MPSIKEVVNEHLTEDLLGRYHQLLAHAAQRYALEGMLLSSHEDGVMRAAASGPKGGPKWHPIRRS